MSLHTAYPIFLGIITSSMTISGRFSFIDCSASSPSKAVKTVCPLNSNPFLRLQQETCYHQPQEFFTINPNKAIEIKFRLIYQYKLRLMVY